MVRQNRPLQKTLESQFSLPGAYRLRSCVFCRGSGVHNPRSIREPRPAPALAQPALAVHRIVSDLRGIFRRARIKKSAVEMGSIVCAPFCWNVYGSARSVFIQSAYRMVADQPKKRLGECVRLGSQQYALRRDVCA